MSEAEAIKVVFQKHARKRLAELMALPLGTSREWLYRRCSNARRRELAVKLLAEMDQQDIERSAIRRTLAKWATE